LKKKITYGLLTIIFFCGLYFGLRFTFGLFTQYNFWTAKQDIKKGKFQIAELGEIPLNSRQKQKLANSYGFNFYYFGCAVTKDILNGTKYYNQTMVEHLEKKYGHGWWTKFQNQLDSIDNSKRLDITADKVSDLVSNLKIVKDEIRLVDSLSKGKRHILLLPFLNDTAKNIYLVKVAEDNGTNYVTYFNFLVDGNLIKILNENGKLDGQ